MCSTCMQPDVLYLKLNIVTWKKIVTFSLLVAIRTPIMLWALNSRHFSSALPAVLKANLNAWLKIAYCFPIRITVSKTIRKADGEEISFTALVVPDRKELQRNELVDSEHVSLSFEAFFQMSFVLLSKF